MRDQEKLGEARQGKARARHDEEKVRQVEKRDEPRARQGEKRTRQSEAI